MSKLTKEEKKEIEGIQGIFNENIKKHGLIEDSLGKEVKGLSKTIYGLLEKNKESKKSEFLDSAIKSINNLLSGIGVEPDVVSGVRDAMAKKLSDIHKEYNKKPEGIVEKISQCLKDVYLFCKTGTRNSEVKEKLNAAIKEINKEIVTNNWSRINKKYTSSIGSI